MKTSKIGIKSGTKFLVTCSTAVSKADDIFILVEASKLSLDDDFMKYQPKNESGILLKKYLIEAIESGLKDFFVAKYDPSFNGRSVIIYETNKRPAVGKSYDWWIENAKKFNPKRHSRLGTKMEYVTFLGFIIKKLMQQGWSAEKAWNAVCNNSKKLGHYINSSNAKGQFELTGSRCIVGFYDLANTFKILADENGTYIAGGCYNNYSDQYPLSDIDTVTKTEDNSLFSVGWIVYQK